MSWRQKIQGTAGDKEVDVAPIRGPFRLARATAVLEGALGDIETQGIESLTRDGKRSDLQGLFYRKQYAGHTLASGLVTYALRAGSTAGMPRPRREYRSAVIGTPDGPIDTFFKFREHLDAAEVRLTLSHTDGSTPSLNFATVSDYDPRGGIADRRPEDGAPHVGQDEIFGLVNIAGEAEAYRVANAQALQATTFILRALVK